MSSPTGQRIHSRTHSQSSKSVRPPSPLSQTHHPLSPLPPLLPTPSLLESVAGAAHYSGVPVDEDTRKRRRRSNTHLSDLATVKPDHQRVLDDLKELYCCRPTKEIFDRTFRDDATFEDPLAKCAGVAEIAAQFFAMPKLFANSETLSFRVMSSTPVPNQIIFWQQQEYTLRLLGRKKVIESIVVVDLDEEEKIVRLVDQWGGSELPSWFGSSLLRTANAKVTPWIVYVPKD